MPITTPIPGQTPGTAPDPYRRLVAKAAQRPAAPARTNPPSDYTRDVIARGSAAVRDRANGATIDSTQPGNKLDWAQSYGPVAQTAGYQDWLNSRGFNPQYTPTFGQTTGKKAGAYAGFKTEGELKAAITGRADQTRQADQQQAMARYNDAAGQLDSVTGQFDTLHDRTVNEQATARSSALNASGQGTSIWMDPNATATPASPTAPVTKTPWGITVDVNSGKVTDPGIPDAQAGHAHVPFLEGAGGVTADQQQSAQNDRNRVSQLDDYDTQLKNWLAEQSQPAIDSMETARQIDATPLSQYQGMAGADYGVDPNLVGGWFPQSSDVADFNNQQNLQSIQDYGVPEAQFKAWQADQQQAQAAADRTAVTDRTAADKQATTDQTAAVQQAVSDATGLDASQLAQAVNMTPDQVAQVVSDPTYQSYSADLADAVGATDNPDFANMSSTEQDSAVAAVVDRVKLDPAMYAILKQVYGAYYSF